MKKAKFIIFNDAHLKTGNEQEVFEACVYMLDYAKKHQIKNIVFAGDMFHSRSFQRQFVLKTFDRILDKFKQYGIKLYLFAGNHDKTLYNSEESFLDVYRFHPNVEFNYDTKVVEIEGISITLLPFFTDEMLVERISNAKPTDILISHFEMQGSCNLGNVSKNDSITQKSLKKFKKVYLGHYHNHHEITKDIVHLPSLLQNNFGEDNKKGFAVIYDDLSYELIKGKFKELSKITINLNKQSSEEINKLINKYKDSNNTIRFEITGEKTKVKSFDTKIFNGTNIGFIKTYEEKEINKIELEKVKSKKVYNKKEVLGVFEEFCDSKQYDKKQGLELVNKLIKE